MDAGGRQGIQALRSAGPGWFAATAALLFALCATLLTSVHAVPRGPQVKAPQTLQETGLYSDFASLRIDPSHLAFSPQYPLWTDGATKRRWISLPPGERDRCIRPGRLGVSCWHAPLEGVFLRRPPDRDALLGAAPDGEWLFAAYAWSPDGKEARLAPIGGVRNAYRWGADGRIRSRAG
jgi:hypothetical protein